MHEYLLWVVLKDGDRKILSLTVTFNKAEEAGIEEAARAVFDEKLEQQWEDSLFRDLVSDHPSARAELSVWKLVSRETGVGIFQKRRDAP